MGQTLLVRIPVVDDKRFSLAVVEACLRNLGNFTVKTCHPGRAALCVTESFDPDLFILDVMMPDMTGLETRQALRDRPDTALHRKTNPRRVGASTSPNHTTGETVVYRNERR